MADAKIKTTKVTLADSKGSMVCDLAVRNIRIKGPDGAITLKDSDADAEGYPIAQSTEMQIQDAQGFGGRTLYFGGTTGHTIIVLEILSGTTN